MRAGCFVSNRKGNWPNSLIMLLTLEIVSCRMLLVTIKSEERKHQGFRFRDGPYQSCTGRCTQQMTVAAIESAYYFALPHEGLKTIKESQMEPPHIRNEALYYHNDFVPWVPFHAHRS